MYCIFCDKFGSYTKHYREATFQYKSRNIDYEECFAVCDGCGKEVYVDSVNDQNCLKREQLVIEAKKYSGEIQIGI